MDRIDVDKAASPRRFGAKAYDDQNSLAIKHGTARDDAKATIAALGPRGRKKVVLGQLRHFAELCDWADWLLDGASFDRKELLPERISVDDDLIIVANLIDHGYTAAMLSQLVSGFGIIVGPVSTTGLMNAPTLADALQLIVRILVAGNPHVDITFNKDADSFDIVFTSCVPQGNLREFYALATLAFVASGIVRYVPESQKSLQFELDCEPDVEMLETIAILSSHIKTGAASSRIIGQSKWLDLPNAAFDQPFWHLSQDRVRNMEVDSDVAGIELRVRRYIKTALVQEKRVPRLKQIAALEGVSERTMLRMLADNDLSFHIISEDVRRVLATEMISLPSVPLSEISESLGFTDLSSFSRSFRKWFGATPGQYRKSQER